ncbi:MBL fold metallo-hydrolase [Bacteroidota bacterium]
MSPLLIFILTMFLGVLPLSIFVYWYKYRGTIIFKTAFAILVTNLIVGIGSYMVGFYGIKYIIFYVPVGYLALLIGNLLFKKFVQRPIKGSIDVLDKISKGDLNVEINEKIKKSNDEIGKMNISLEELIQNLKDTAEFARQVGEGNLEHEIDLLSSSDHLRIALVDMKEKLKEATKSQEEKRIDEEKRSWVNEGLAKLNEILRKQDSAEELSYLIISYLINYMEANQGGIFIRNNEDPNNIFLELKAFYAYNRRKFIKKTFELGEGLVGNCAHKDLDKNNETYNKERFNNFINKVLPDYLENLKLQLDSIEDKSSKQYISLNLEYNENLNYYEDIKNIKFRKPDITFDDYYRFKIADERIMVEFPGPGHTSDNIVVKFSNHNVIHTGDLVFNGSFPYMIIEHGVDVYNWIKILDDLYEENIITVIPGHGEVGRKLVIKDQSDYFKDLSYKIDALKNAGYNLEEIKNRIDINDFDLSGNENQFPVNIKVIYTELDNKGINWWKF